MRAVLLDTHVWAWGFYASFRLSPKAKASVEDAKRVWISPASFYEVAQKTRLGKWPEMKAFADEDLLRSIRQQNAEVAVPGAEIFLHAGSMDWPHRDPFDRLLAATALHYGVPIISADPVFDGVVSRIW